MAINPTEAMELAEKLDSGELKQMPEFLSESDKDMVKESLRFLRAQQLAYKTWYVREKYCLSLQDQLKKEADAALKQAEAYKRASEASSAAALKQSYVSNYEKAMAKGKRLLSQWQLIGSEEGNRYNDLEKRLQQHEQAYIRYAMKHQGDAAYPSNVYRNLAERYVGIYKERPSLETSDRTLARLKSSFDQRVANISKEMAKMGMVPLDALFQMEDLHGIAKEEAQKAASKADIALRRSQAANVKYGLAVKETQDLRAQTMMAAAFYSLAALGSVLEELGDNLAY